MNAYSRQATIVATSGVDADFAESALSSHGFTVTKHPSAHDLFARIQSQLASANGSGPHLPDVIVLAGSSSAFLGQEASNVRGLTSTVPVVVVSSSTNVADAVDLMKYGVLDVVQLPCHEADLAERVDRVLESVAATAACKVLTAKMRKRVELLTPAEHDVVDAMLDGLANKQIAQRLSIGLRTVELRRSKIMRKMQAKSVAELIKFICISGILKERHAQTMCNSHS